jgi:hypothetical protein
MAQPEPTTWTVHLAARRPGRAIAAVLVILCGLAAVHLLGHSWAITAVAAVLLLGSIAEFLFPVTYTLDAAGAHARYLASRRIIPWAQVRRVYLGRNRIKLSPLAAPGWAENYRGVLLRMADRDAVLAQVTAWLEAAGAAPEIVEEPGP